MTEFTLGAQASCSDGSCGEVIRTILDPATRTVTHLVIEPKHRKMDGRLVPIDLVDAAGGEIRLRCSLAQFEQLEPAEEVDLAEGADYGGGYGQAGAVQGYGNVGGMGVGGFVLRHGDRHGPGPPDADRPQSRRPAGRDGSGTP